MSLIKIGCNSLFPRIKSKGISTGLNDIKEIHSKSIKVILSHSSFHTAFRMLYEWCPAVRFKRKNVEKRSSYSHNATDEHASLTECYAVYYNVSQ